MENKMEKEKELVEKELSQLMEKTLMMEDEIYNLENYGQ